MGLWDDLQTNIKKYQDIEISIQKSLRFKTMLDIYSLYIAPMLNKEEIEKEMKRASSRGKTRCKLVFFQSLIPCDAEMFQMLLDFIKKTIFYMFDERRFGICSENNVIYITFFLNQPMIA